MSNIANALYQFTNEICSASAGALGESILHLDIYEKYSGGDKWIRFSGMRRGEPVLIGDGTVRKDNAVHYVYFVARPLKDTPIERMAARELSEQMADEWLTAISLDQTLGDRVCGIGELIQIDDWIMPGTVKMPVTMFQIKVNPR